ncbi:MAG: 3-oxoacyl-[acyl-carrier-protein] synthase III C-terminal domain-containing protein [Pseudomonadota bacterium]
MIRTVDQIGMVSYGLYTPAGFETADEIASRSGLTPAEIRALGIERKCKPTLEDQPIPMAVKAANQAFERADGIKPEEVDLVLWTGEEYKDYIAQTASIRVQEETGCRNAWAFDLVDQGVTTVLGLRIARDMMIGDQSIKTVLLAGGTRNGDLVDYSNPDTRFMLPFSAGGGAVLLRRGHERNILHKVAFMVDPEMADEVYVPGGGTEVPFSADNLNSKIMFFQTPRPEVVKTYLEGRWPQALAEAAQKVLSGHSPDYLALRHLNPAQRTAVLKQLGLNPEQSAALDQWGCHGTNDVILSLDLGLKSGALKDGSRLVLVSGGIGFTYAAALIRWGFFQG